MSWLATVALYKALTVNFCALHMPEMQYGCTEVVMECVLDEGFNNYDFCADTEYLGWNYNEISELDAGNETESENYR